MNSSMKSAQSNKMQSPHVFNLYKNTLGKWVLSFDQKEAAKLSEPQEVVVVRAFPIESPSTGISILSGEGKELVWIEALELLNDDQRASVEGALREREFMPEILKLERVSSFTTPCIWHIQTSRGTTELELKGEEDIRRMSSKTLIVSDRYGVQFLIKDLPKLDRHSRKLLDRFF